MRRTVLLVTVLVLGACGRGSGAERLRSLPSATGTSAATAPAVPATTATPPTTTTAHPPTTAHQEATSTTRAASAPRSDPVTALATPSRVAPDPTADPAVAGRAIAAFGDDLLSAVATANGAGGNVVVSPMSVAVALAMLEPGAVGDAQANLRRLLRVDDPAAFHSSMNALTRSLESRVAPPASSWAKKPGEVAVRLANAAYLQPGYPFLPAYLAAVGRNYGPVLNAANFRGDPDAVAHDINRFVAGATRDRIPRLVADGVLRHDTVLALVNALYLKASWFQTFDRARTADHPFTRLDGRTLSVPMMDGASDSSARGDGWVAASKAYVGDLAVEFVLPDAGRFDDVAGRFGAVIADFEQRRIHESVELAVPRFTTRFGAELSPVLRALGLTALYEPGHLLGIAPDDSLVLDKAIHQTFLAMDEDGTEAAAATIMAATATAASTTPPVPVVLDRPFLFRLFDRRTGTTLFQGRILDPLA